MLISYILEFLGETYTREEIQDLKEQRNDLFYLSQKATDTFNCTNFDSETDQNTLEQESSEEEDLDHRSYASDDFEFMDDNYFAMEVAVEQ